MDTRNRNWQLGLAGIGLALGCFHGAAFATQSPQIPLAAKAIPQFVQPLPKLSVQSGGTIQTVPGNQFLTLRMCEFKANVLPAAAVPGYAGTWVWGYLPDPAGTSTCSQLVTQYGNAQGIVDTYIGPVIVNDRGSSTDMHFVNDLGSAASTNVLAYKYSTDQTLHWADPLNNMCNHMAMPPAFGSPCAANYDGSIPAVPHLHGGEVPPELDGGPDAWFTSDGNIFGPKYYSAAIPGNSALYKYPNSQEASPIWFHDHTLGVTRLNVYAGLAGGYFIEDPAILPTSKSTTRGTQGSCATGCLPENLHPIADVIPIVIQDRMFDTGGQLFFQADSAGGILWALNPEHPYWSPEFVGDTIVVNGKAWPFLSVEAKRYRFLFLNGSNARTYELFLVNPVTKAVGPPMWVIGTDGGYLDTPVKIDPALKQKLTIMPGERYEVIIDFRGFANTNLVMNNTGRTPYPGGTPPPGTTLGKIMQFRVGGTVADASYDPATLASLRSGSKAIVRLTTAGVPPASPAKTRALTLNEVMGMAQNATNPVTGLMTAYPGGPLEILVNNTKWSGERITGVNASGMFTMETRPDFTNGMSERPMEGDTEVWEIINLTADAHPIHLHLVQFQLINRQSFDAAKYGARYAAAFPGGGYDPMTGQPYPAGVFIPGFGPPLNYDTGNPNAFGGNPSVTPFLKGLVNLPFPHEQGWKDTIITYPGQVTRIAVRWAPTSLPTTASAAELGFPFDPSGGGQFNYVWHCHIIDHEDNEMMRPDEVLLNTYFTGTRLTKGIDY